MQVPIKNVPQNQVYSHNNNDHYIVEHKQELKCICELCSCGKHKCPRKAAKAAFQTSYNRDYKMFTNIVPVDQRPPYRYEQRHYPLEVLKSNYQQNFDKQISIEPSPGISISRLQEVGKTILTPHIPFHGVSSYKQQYQPYKMIKIPQTENPELNVLQSYQKNYIQKPNVKFEGISSYKSAFLAPPQPNKRFELKSDYKKPDVPFYGISSYKQQFKPIEIAPSQPYFDGNPNRDMKTVKFEGKSAYKQQYQPYKLYVSNPSDSRISVKSECKFDKVVIPSVNYINDKDHIYYDSNTKKFY